MPDFLLSYRHQEARCVFGKHREPGVRILGFLKLLTTRPFRVGDRRATRQVFVSPRQQPHA